MSLRPTPSASLPAGGTAQPVISRYARETHGTAASGELELVLHRPERQRDDARVQLAHERAEADNADGEPGRARVGADEIGPRRLGEYVSVSEHFCYRAYPGPGADRERAAARLSGVDGPNRP